MKPPKQPTLRKRPKMPKQSSPQSTWDNYNRRLSEVIKENDNRIKEYNKKKAEYDKAMNNKKKAIEKARRAGSKPASIKMR